MKYYIDFEFDGPTIISMAMVCENGAEIYGEFAGAAQKATNAWVRENVVPMINADAAVPTIWGPGMHQGDHQTDILGLIGTDRDPEIVADWPADIELFMKMLHDGQGNMINLPSFSCRVERIDAYPTDLAGAVQHNALWDARALRHKLMERAA